MSTYYRDLKEPWSSIRVDLAGLHYKITPWEEGAKAGELYVSFRNKDAVLSQFFTDTHVCQVSCDQYHVRLGKFVEPRTDQLLSSYGELASYEDLCRSHPKPRPSSREI